MDQRVANAIDDILSSTGRRFSYAVDLGCGFGNYGRMLKKYCNHLVGVDRNRVRLGVAAGNGYDEVVVSDVLSYQIPPQADAVFLFDVVEHFNKQQGVELLSSLQGRTVILTTPSKFFRPALDGHVSLWSREDLEELGFYVEEIQFSSFLKYRVYGVPLLAIRG